ncbi:MAG TPA: VOC family protein [Hyphomicrobiales bacterium]|nr:VOC family protein [Hyphomicrobiales bacterium]
MARGLDHLVVAVRDLDAAAAAWRAMGFRVGAENRHPFGTHNRLVQLADRTFIELLAVAEPGRVPEPVPGQFSFAAFNRDLLRWREGLSTIILKSADAAADTAAFQGVGLGDFAMLEFFRGGERGDGTAVEVGFRLAFAASPRLPDLAFAACQHLTPDRFWDPALQHHANGAAATAAVVIVADNPSDHHIFLSALTGVREMRATSLGVFIALPTGAIEVVTPAAFAALYGALATRAAIRFAVADLDRAAATLAQGGVAHEARGALIVVPAEAAGGVAVAFAAHGG